LWILETSGAGSDPQTFRIRQGAVKTFGRASGADFVVQAALVSRVHCRIEAAADSLHVIDLSSTNGTYVNGERIDRARLTDGDRLRIGRVELTVRQSDAAGDS
jgi:pSer/pThr/pTyr-binding forkhead associated (FHA) protein